METETQDPRLDDCGPDHVTLVAPGHQEPVVLNTDDLRAIVQQAYDQYGIAADPFASPGSADPDDAPRIVEHQHGHVVHRTAEFARGGQAATHAMAMAHNAGVRA